MILIQILVILVLSRVCASLLRFVGQPPVIGEMVAGILLGKSAFAVLWPEGFAAVFPEGSLSHLYFLSQAGLILFMFMVGWRLKLSELKDRGPAALMISHTSIVVPFILGSIAAFVLFDSYGPKNFDFISFALFMGIAMSITAFPVLARLLEEKKLTDSRLGIMALTCAAIDDVTAWCVLAAVVGLVKAGTLSAAAGVLATALVYIVVMLKFVRPSLVKVMKTELGGLWWVQAGLLVFLLLGSAGISEIIGIHALFGAFLAGVILPKEGSVPSAFFEKIERPVTVLLLPLFFAFTGLRTRIDLLDTMDAWMVALGVTALAVLGKMAGSAIAARVSGMEWRESWALGALMNTRGLMELVVLNIGYDLGILSPRLFAIFVLMALVTTFMTSPLLSFILSGRQTSRVD